MVAAMTLFGEEWEMAEPPLLEAQVEADEDFDEEDEVKLWSGKLGSWLPAMLAPKDQVVDLWVDVYELEGIVVRGCWWNAQAAIPDWYTTDENGQTVLAAKPWQRVSYWKPADKPNGPLVDGGPGWNARTNVPDDPLHFSGVLKERYDRYSELKEAA
jgi:hypothetical protein